MPVSNLDVLERQEEVLVFDSFDESAAFAVGSAMRQACKQAISHQLSREARVAGPQRAGGLA